MQSSHVTAGEDGPRPASVGAAGRLRAQQVEVLYDQLPIALTASVVAALILATLLWSVTPAPVLSGWLAVLTLTTLSRGLLVHRYRQSPARLQQSGYWLAWFIAGALVSGIVWDAVILLLTPRGSTLHIGIAVLWVCGLTAGSVASLAAVKGAFFSFSLPALVPAASYMLIAGNKTEATISGAMFLFLAFLSLNALRMHATVRRSLLLQFQNSELIAHLDTEKARIEKLNAQLERRVAERTADLTEANAAKSRFLVAASHDLRQPLQTISFLTAVLAQADGEPTRARAVQELRDTISVMASLLDALLDVSKLDSGVVAPDVREFPIAELLDRLRLDFMNHASDSGLELRVVSSGAVIRSDPVLLEHMIRNLLANAIRYTRHGRVLLGCRRRGGHLRIEVWDTGIGIPREQIDRIFEEFYQLDNPARDRSKGWGLGLAIVARSARFLGHHVDVRSIPGKGSLFAVEVPRGTAPVRALQAGNAGKLVGNDHREATILLVEDERAVREAMRDMLELYDFRVHAAANIEEAYRQCQALAVVPDLVIADYRLPMNRSGIDVMRGVRELTQAAIPGIILTGDISPRIQQEARQDRLEVIRKPVAADELLALINRQLSQAVQSAC